MLLHMFTYVVCRILIRRTASPKYDTGRAIVQTNIYLTTLMQDLEEILKKYNNLTNKSCRTGYFSIKILIESVHIHDER